MRLSNCNRNSSPFCHVQGLALARQPHHAGAWLSGGYSSACSRCVAMRRPRRRRSAEVTGVDLAMQRLCHRLVSLNHCSNYRHCRPAYFALQLGLHWQLKGAAVHIESQSWHRTLQLKVGATRSHFRTQDKEATINAYWLRPRGAWLSVHTTRFVYPYFGPENVQKLHIISVNPLGTPLHNFLFHNAATECHSRRRAWCF